MSLAIETVRVMQRPEVGIARVSPSIPFEASQEVYPWIGSDATVPTVHVDMGEGISFRYGSVIGLNNYVRRLAGRVSVQESSQTEGILFRTIPPILNGEPCQSVDRPLWQYPGTNLFKVGNHGETSSRLVFDIVWGEERPPVVIRVGICKHDKEPDLFRHITQLRLGKRRKMDGLKHT